MMEKDGHERYEGYFRGGIDNLMTNWMVRERRKTGMTPSI